MGLASIDKCLITDEPTINIQSDVDALEYSITYNGNKFSFCFNSTTDWNTIIVGETKSILQAMLYNNKWQIEQETFITKNLIDQIIRLADYPKTFDEKINYYLLYAYELGGKEYNSTEYDFEKYLIAYAKNKNQYESIISALVSKKFIFLETNNRILSSIQNKTFRLEENGIVAAKELKSQKIKIEKLKLLEGNRPGIAFCYVKGDEKIGQTMERYFSDKGFTTFQSNVSSNQKDESYIRSFRSKVYNEDVNYVLFIKSYKADADTVYSNIVGMTVEAHYTTRKNQKFIYVGFIDDSPYNSQPRFVDYHNQVYDIRIISNRDRLLIDILTDWTQKTNNNRAVSPAIKDVKIKFLTWLIRQTQVTQNNPVYVTYSLLKDMFQSDKELLACISELANEQVITYTAKDVGDFYMGEYTVTVLNNAPNFLNNAVKEKNGSESKINSPKFGFPKINISEPELQWLKIVYEKFLKHEKFETDAFFAKFWGDFPEEFHPNNIDNRLLSNGKDITLLGIWHIDQHSEILQYFNAVVLIIKEFLGNDRNEKEAYSVNITTEDIIFKQPLLDKNIVSLILKLLSNIGGFMSSFGQTNKQDWVSFNFSVREENYSLYRKYKGLTRLLQDLFEHGKPNYINEENEQNQQSNTTKPISKEYVYNTTTINVKDSDVNPVLGVKELADDMANLISGIPNEQGKMIGIFGRWGRGKSFFIKELWASINKNKKVDESFERVDYHAWKYQDTPASWAYLYELLADTYNPKPKSHLDLEAYFVYYDKIMLLNFERHGWSQIIKFFTSVSVFCTITIGFILWGSTESQLYVPVIGIPIAFATLSAFLIKIKKEYSTEAMSLIKKYGLKHSFKDTMGVQAEIQKELVSLLKIWIPLTNGKKKIVLFVEDIDRCSEDKIIQIIDALRIMIEEPEIAKRIVIIAAIDERVLKRAIKSKYYNLLHLDLKESNEKFKEEEDFKKLNELTNEYLDKLFISGIKLGELSPSERLDYFVELTKDDRIIEDEKETNEPPLDDEKESPLINTEIPRDVKVLFEDSSNGNEESDSNTELPNEKNLFKLTRIEDSILKNHLSKWNNVTPRKIRIFYYRYLLAKNLLIKKYANLNRDNVWSSKELCEILIRQLADYTDLHDPEKISQTKQLAIEKIEEVTQIVPFSEYGVLNIDVVELLTVLELVIAY